MDLLGDSITVPVTAPWFKGCHNVLWWFALGSWAYNQVHIPKDNHDKSAFFTTVGQMGRADAKPDVLVSEFLEHVSKNGGSVLDVGAGFGIASVAALDATDMPVIALDTEPDHLLVVHKSAPERERKDRLHLYLGAFPSDFNLNAGSISNILVARMIHLIEPEKVVVGLRRLLAMAAPGATIFVSATTPRTRKFEHFLPEYDRRYAKYIRQRQKSIHKYGEGISFPGHAHLAHNCPAYAHECQDDLWLYTPLTLSDVLRRAGWEDVEAFFYDEPDGRDENQSKGGERVGAIARKPGNIDLARVPHPLTPISRSMNGPFPDLRSPSTLWSTDFSGEAPFRRQPIYTD